MPTTPQVSEHRLVVAARKHGEDAAQKDLVKDARGLVQAVRDAQIRNDDDDSMMTDYIGALVRGRKALEQHVAPMKDVLNKAKNALLDVIRGPVSELEAAEKIGRKKQADYRLAKQRKIEAEKRAAQERARQEATVSGGPPVSVPAPIQEKVVRGAGAASHLTRTLKVEMVNAHECDPDWLVLNPQARADAMKARDAGQIQVPDGHENAVEWRGIRVWNEVSTATKA